MIIPARFNGPPSSGHGGYSAGIVGTTFDGPAEVTLLAPPPLETEMTFSDGTLRDGDQVIATAEPTTIDLGPAPRVSLEQARAAMQDPEWLQETHPFPTCYACGPAREDGLRLFTGQVADDVFACVWKTGGSVSALDVWTALDCPSSAPAADPTGERAIVLARLAVDIRADVPGDSDLVIVSAPVSTEGRKHVNAVWLLDNSGRELAVGRALWIALRRA